MDSVNNDTFKQVAEAMGMTLKSWKQVDMGDGVSFVSSEEGYGRGSDGELVGNYAFELLCCTTASENAESVTRKVVLRARRPGIQMVNDCVAGAEKMDKEEGMEVRVYLDYLLDAEKKDVLTAKAAMEGYWFGKIMARIFNVSINPTKKSSFFVMEFFEPELFTHVDCIEGGAGFNKYQWTDADIKTVLTSLAYFHAHSLNDTSALPAQLKNCLRDGIDVLARLGKYILASSKNLNKREPSIWSALSVQLSKRIANNLPEIVEALNQYPQCFVHNDASPRNLCIRSAKDGKERLACLYDWEISCIHVPQRDIAEFLTFVSEDGADANIITSYAEFYCKSLKQELIQLKSCAKLIEKMSNQEAFMRIFDFCMMDMLAVKIAAYGTSIGAFGVSFPFIPRIVRVSTSYIDSVIDKYNFS